MTSLSGCLSSWIADVVLGGSLVSLPWLLLGTLAGSIWLPYPLLDMLGCGRVGGCSGLGLDDLTFLNSHLSHHFTKQTICSVTN